MLKIPSQEGSRQFPGNLGALLDNASERYPERNGVGIPGEMFTFAKYHEKVCRLVYGLKMIGLKRNDRVIHSSMEPSWYAAVSLAVFRIGAILVPVNPRIGPYELAHIVSETMPRFHICERDKLATAVKAYELNPGLTPPCFITIDEKAPSTVFMEELDFSKTDPHWEKMATGETAMVVYTAAMDGYPLGAELTHGSLFFDSASFAEKSFRKNDAGSEILFSLLPLFHTYGFTNGFLVPLVGGVTCLLFGTSVRSRTVVDHMKHYRPTQIISIPAIFHALFKPLSGQLDVCSRLRNLTSGGIKIPDNLLESYKNILELTISEGYGLTESSPVVAWNGLDRPPKFGTVGPPLPCCKIKIVDEKGQKLPPGEEGEVLVKGSNLFSGYFKKPEHTKNAFVNGWFKSGDLGHVDKDNYLTLTGLKKDMINVFGLKAYPKEIERLLLYHPEIESARIFRELHEKYGDMVAGEISLKPGSTMNKQGFFNWCRKNISPYKIPRSIRIN